jgi:hypothetical protein
MDDDDADTCDDSSEKDEEEEEEVVKDDDDEDSQDEQQSLSSETDKHMKSSSESESSSEQESGRTITRSFACQKRQAKIKCGVPSRKCHRCGKILSTDFCLCVYKIPFKCERCNLKFAGLPEFKSHMQSVHTCIRVNVNASNNISPNVTKEISQSSALFHHKNEISKFESELLRTEQSQEVHTCPTCREVFNTKLGLMAHSLNHIEREETNTYKCNHCNREFTSTVRLSIHMTRMHIEEKKFVCDVCNKGFR